MNNMPVVLTPDQLTVGRRRLSRLSVAFWIYIAGLAALVLVAVFQLSSLVLWAWGTLVIGALAYLILLASLASLLKRSTIVYAGGTLLTSPIGYFISFAYIKTAAARAGLLSRASP